MQSGAGEITYTSTDSLTVESARPTSKGESTAETANSTYGELNHGPQTTFKQSFGVAAPSAPRS